MTWRGFVDLVLGALIGAVVGLYISHAVMLSKFKQLDLAVAFLNGKVQALTQALEKR